MQWLTGLYALLAALGCLVVGLGLGRWLRLRREVSLQGVGRVLLTVTQGLLLLATLGGIDQRPLSRALLFVAPMAFFLGLLTALGASNEPLGRWWQLWRWRFAPPER